MLIICYWKEHYETFVYFSERNHGLEEANQDKVLVYGMYRNVYIIACIIYPNMSPSM